MKWPTVTVICIWLFYVNDDDNKWRIWVQNGNPIVGAPEKEPFINICIGGVVEINENIAKGHRYYWCTTANGYFWHCAMLRKATLALITLTAKCVYKNRTLVNVIRWPCMQNKCEFEISIWSNPELELNNEVTRTAIFALMFDLIMNILRDILVIFHWRG